MMVQVGVVGDRTGPSARLLSVRMLLRCKLALDKFGDDGVPRDFIG